MKKSTKKTTPRVVSTRPLPTIGQQPAESALVGGVGNRKGPIDYKKGK